MANSPTDILTTIQNGVIAINNLALSLSSVTITSSTGIVYLNATIVSSTTLPST